MAMPDLVNRALDVAARAGGTVLNRLQDLRAPGVGAASTTDTPERAEARWRAVTVLCAPDRIDPEALPAPLAEMGPRIDVRVRAAPGDKGTELSVRFRQPEAEQDVGELRSALRQAKQLIEVGEVLRIEPQPHGHRRATPQGRLLDGVIRRAPEEGVL